MVTKKREIVSLTILGCITFIGAPVQKPCSDTPSALWKSHLT